MRRVLSLLGEFAAQHRARSDFSLAAKIHGNRTRDILVPSLGPSLTSRSMTRVALACFEEQPDGSWICRQDTTIAGARGYRAVIKRGERFLQHTTFAGYDDFTGHLASECEQRFRSAP
jgi:hypothetical protein